VVKFGYKANPRCIGQLGVKLSLVGRQRGLPGMHTLPGWRGAIWVKCVAQAFYTRRPSIEAVDGEKIKTHCESEDMQVVTRELYDLEPEASPLCLCDRVKEVVNYLLNPWKNASNEMNIYTFMFLDLNICTFD
jgi:hypothetical protein